MRFFYVRFGRDSLGAGHRGDVCIKKGVKGIPFRTLGNSMGNSFFKSI